MELVQLRVGFGHSLWRHGDIPLQRCRAVRRSGSLFVTFWHFGMMNTHGRLGRIPFFFSLLDIKPRPRAHFQPCMVPEPHPVYSASPDRLPFSFLSGPHSALVLITYVTRFGELCPPDHVSLACRSSVVSRHSDPIKRIILPSTFSHGSVEHIRSSCGGGRYSCPHDI